MSRATLLDTRTPYRSRNTQTQLNTTAPTSQTGSPGLTLFRRAVHDLVRSSHQERAVRRENVIGRLRASRDPMGYINELIDHCAVWGGSEGLDIGIDVLSQFGDLVLQYAREFWKKDVERWGAEEDSHRHHFNDDAWYILLRSAARSDLEPWQKAPMLLSCSIDGPKSVREAGAHALGDMGGAVAARLLRRLRDSDHNPSVRAAATEVLDDLEG
jgi:hypothetical protein